MRPALVATAMLLIAACADPRAACVARATAGLRALDAEIAETEAALARGYRIAPGSRVTAGVTLCAEDSPLTLCVGGDRPVYERRLRIDPAAERARYSGGQEPDAGHLLKA